MTMNNTIKITLWSMVVIGLAVLGCRKKQEYYAPHSSSPSPSPASAPYRAEPQPVEPVAPVVNPTRETAWPFAPVDNREVSPSELWTTKNYLVILDSSGSMAERGCSSSESKLTVAKRAIEAFSRSVPADANLGFVLFDQRSDPRQLVSLGLNNREKFIVEVNSARDGGGTPLTEALHLAYQAINKEAVKQLGYGEYMIVVVTDGIANDEYSLHHLVTQITSESPVVIYTIGFCIGNRHTLNQPNTTIYKEANSPEELAEALKGVLAESEEFVVTEFEK
ncbi:TPA: hypothetical protein DF272_03895 [Candidatus Falkowbacteria bacterium]|nr:hypothetical protein [Candidatus Falkowbacteria bacterium]